MAEKNPQKNHQEKPTPEQLKKLKKSPAREKKPPYPYPIEEKEDISTGSQTEENEKEEKHSLDLEEICGNLWVVLYQLGGVLRKGFEPLTDNVKNLLAPPSARCAVKYHVESYMKDEFLILGILGIDISKRLMAKKPKKVVEDSKEEEKK